MNYEQYIVRDPKICGGELVVKGTRVTVRTVVASLAEGASVDEILADFPTLTEVDVRRCSPGIRHASDRFSVVVPRFLDLSWISRNLSRLQLCCLYCHGGQERLGFPSSSSGHFCHLPL